MNIQRSFVLVGILLLLAGCGETAPEETAEPVVTEVEALPIYISTMTHMEGIFKDDQVENVFLKHVEDLRWAMDLFDEYGAKLTIESEQSFAKANTKWDLNFLAEVVERGHGVGTHMDAGFNETSLSALTADFKENKKLIDDLVGAENNRGMSGGSSGVDWVTAAREAGFEFMDAVTALGYLSMDESLRPEGWTDAYIKKIVYHDPIPVDFEERIYPRVFEDAQDLESDEEGLVVLFGDVGEFSSLAEGRKTCGTQCTFDSDDAKAFLAAIDEAEAVRDPSKFARLNMHIPAALLVKENEALLRELLAGIQEYTDAGIAKWATQVEAYEAFMVHFDQ
ncbi:MAG: hypothetical protein AAB383_02670 [Patescibacteria group bacterium]